MPLVLSCIEMHLVLSCIDAELRSIETFSNWIKTGKGARPSMHFQKDMGGIIFQKDLSNPRTPRMIGMTLFLLLNLIVRL